MTKHTDYPCFFLLNGKYDCHEGDIWIFKPLDRQAIGVSTSFRCATVYLTGKEEAALAKAIDGQILKLRKDIDSWKVTLLSGRKNKKTIDLEMEKLKERSNTLFAEKEKFSKWVKKTSPQSLVTIFSTSQGNIALPMTLDQAASLVSHALAGKIVDLEFDEDGASVGCKISSATRPKSLSGKYFNPQKRLII